MSPVYTARAVARDARGRELARLPVSEERVTATGLRDALDAATVKGTVWLTQDPRVDTVVVSVEGPSGERISATEYADDLRAGRHVTADESTLLADASIDPDEKRAAIERIKDAAVAAMPDVARRAANKIARRAANKIASDMRQYAEDHPDKETATVPATDPLQDFFGPGWKPSADKTIQDCKDKFDKQGPFETSDDFHKRVLGSNNPHIKDWMRLNGRAILESLEEARRQMDVDSFEVGKRAFSAIVEHLRATGQMPSGTNPSTYDGKLDVCGTPIHNTGRDNETLQTVRKARPGMSSRKATKGDIARYIKAGAKNLDLDGDYDIVTVLPQPSGRNGWTDQSTVYILDEAAGIDLDKLTVNWDPTGGIEAAGIDLDKLTVNWDPTGGIFKL